MLKKLLTATLWLLLTFPTGYVLAQTGTITGTVTDSTTGEPIPGVNVVVQGLNLGSATNAQGVYTISNVPVGEQTLVASFIGYETETLLITVEAGTNQVDMQLTSRVLGLDNVVVTALGVEREERSLGYSVQAVEGEELAKVPDANFISSLQGKVAGASFYTSNAMGGSSRIVLRGVNSISGNNQPLIVVDGIVINNASMGADNEGNGGYDYGNFGAVVNPANIKSVTVLKGPSAAALYGSRAANGVIQITTKNGSALQDGIGVTISTSLMAKSVYGLPDYQNKYGGGIGTFSTLDGDLVLDEGEIEVDFNGDGTIDYTGPDQLVPEYAVDQSWGPRMDGRPVRQWYSWDEVNGLLGQATPWVPSPTTVKDFFRPGLEFNTTVSMAQGGENFNYRLSLGAVNVQGIFPNSNLARKQINFNGGVDLTDDFHATVVANYIDEDGHARPGTGYDELNAFQQFNTFGQRQVDYGPDSYMSAYRDPDDGSQRNWNWTNLYEASVTGDLIYHNNPYWIQYVNYETDDTERLFGKVRLAYDLTDALTLSGEVGTDYSLQRIEERIATGSINLGDFDQETYEYQETNAEARLTWDGMLSEDFSLRVFGATAYRYESYSEFSASTEGGLSVPGIYTVENSVGRPTMTDFFEEKAVFSLYGAATLGWRDLLYFDLTARNDWSSTLPAQHNAYFYPSAALSFVFSALPALKGSDVLSFGKLRFSVARVGSDTDPYQLASVYPISLPFSGSPMLTVDEDLNNPNLKPEITSAWEIGTELEFFNNRIGLDLTYYYDETRNQILAVDVPTVSGYNSVLLNAGTMTNQGVEVALRATPVLTQDFQWDVNVNWAKNVNEVVELTEGLQAFTIGGPLFGPSVQARVGHPYGAFYGHSFVYDKSGDLVLLDNGWPMESKKQKVLGTYQPDWTAGVSSTLSYKGFTASIALAGQKGGLIWSLSNHFGLGVGLFQETVEGHVRQLGVIPEGVWFPKNFDDNPDNDVDPTKAEGVPFTQRLDAEHYFGAFASHDFTTLYDASYINLREVTLGYTLPRQWLASTPIQTLTVSLIGRNLATLYKEAPNIDPSYALGASNLQGLEASQLPPHRAYGFSLQVRL